ncbi:MAG: hypothetical protein RBR97_11635 [Bacteroidales bacterium]|nr:hypothetical protein [Bacteroidales bacterium]
MKNKIVFLIIFLLINSLICMGQKSDTTHQIGLAIISQVNQGNSYITFPTDIGNIEPLWFEGNLMPNFHLRQSKDSRLMGVLTPQIILRMYQEASYPVRSPSYIPQFTFYYLFKDKGNQKSTSVFGRIAHHSNGQAESFFLDNGDINTKSGDFSTNYFEGGVIRTNFNKRFNAYQFFKTSLEVYPQNWYTDDLNGIFSPVRWHNTFSIFKLSNKDIDRTKRSADISLKGEATWMFGSLNEWKIASINRLSLSFTFYYHPRFLEDVGLFVQYYQGLDYYNMSFNHQLYVLRFGIMTEKLRF